MSNDFIAYFSMEIALEPGMPTYSGGLGVLAGDTIRSAADLKLPMVAVTLVHCQDYFAQKLDANGWQTEAPVAWDVAKFCRELPPRTQVGSEGRTVHVRAWQYTVKGISGHEVPVILLDADLPENSEWDRALTDHLYGGDSHYRLCQEVILGIGGVRMLRALGYHDVSRFHMNEGHAALLGLELLDERARWLHRERFNHEDVQAIKRQCVFTTHTPVPAGHDKFPLDHVRRVLGRDDFFEMREVFSCEGELNMTYLALNLSHYVTGWAIDSVAQGKETENRTSQEAQSLYQKLGQVVLPAFYQQRDDWLRVMRHAIALNASHFNTQRMVQQYVVKAYFE